MKYLFVLLLMVPLSVFSQADYVDKEKTFSLGIVPQYAIINGIRADFDLEIKNKPNHRFVLSPLIFISTKSNLAWDYNSMVGAGLELQHKIFLKYEPNKKGVYFAYGPTFNYFSVTDEGLTAKQFIDNGGNYIGLVEDEMTTGIYKLGGNFILGIQYVISDFLYIDPYFGIGFRFSFDDTTTGLHTYYNDWWGDMGYSGTLMVGGIRIGVFL